MKNRALGALGLLAFLSSQTAQLHAADLQLRIRRVAPATVAIECDAALYYSYTLHRGTSVTSITNWAGIDSSESQMARFTLRTDTGDHQSFFRVVRQGLPPNDPAHQWISAAASHSAALKRDGTLWTWGYNHDGAIGDGTLNSRASPFLIESTNRWLAVTAGQDHTAGLATDGSLWIWGRNTNGEIGNGTTDASLVPARLASQGTWTFVAGGFRDTFAFASNGDLWGWGVNQYGQVGDGTYEERDIPVPVGVPSVLARIAVGREFVIGIDPNGSLWGWGSNGNGQLGTGTSSFNGWPLPANLTISASWTQVAAGWDHTLAISSNGELWAWGANADGEVGNDNSGVDQLSPTNIGVGLGKAWHDIAAGAYHSLAVASDGTLWAWGRNAEYQLGDGTQTERPKPVQIGTFTQWRAVAAGEYHSLALAQDGSLWSWGGNYQGAVGDGTFNIPRPTPVQVGDGANDWGLE